MTNAIKVISAEELYYTPIPQKENEMIVEDMIPQGLTILAGPPKSCKSWLVMDMGIYVSAGVPLLGRKTLGCGVLYFDRRVLLIPEARELIEAAKARQKEKDASTEGYIFSMNEDPLLYSAIQKAFYKYCDDMGIEGKSSHKARKTYVSSLAAVGVSINTIRQYVGHQDERTTLANYCYDRSTDEEKMKQVQKALES